jgi:integrase
VQTPLLVKPPQAAEVMNLMQSLEPSNLHCPQCASNRVWKDGHRNLRDGDTIQWWLCRVCGYRFSEKPPQEKPEWQINTPSTLRSARQICVEEAKNLDPQTEIKTVAGESPQDVKGKIVEFSFWMLKQGYSQATIKGRIKLLNRLLRLGANFNDEDSLKGTIAQQEWSVNRKVNAVDAYDSFLKWQGKSWTPPIYRRVRKLPFIPTEIELDQLIAGCSKKVATFLQLLKETGMRCGEACQLLNWTDIDLEQRLIRVTPENGSNPRILPISVKLRDMFAGLPKVTDTVFGASDLMQRNFNKQRKRLVFKLRNPRMSQITFHTFRHWKATMEYHKTRDILHVKEILGHKSLNSTMLYTQLISFNDDDFTAAVAHSQEEACKLVESGFDFVCDFDGNKIFRKRK